mmetsp:Transcript_8417/g.10356  ORF Transcript_8417/g.10356 Transcript_8417/m.10356 type:complete len:220 (+) Transcript_8417:207-866(+)
MTRTHGVLAVINVTQGATKHVALNHTHSPHGILIQHCISPYCHFHLGTLHQINRRIQHFKFFQFIQIDTLHPRFQSLHNGGSILLNRKRSIHHDPYSARVIGIEEGFFDIPVGLFFDCRHGKWIDVRSHGVNLHKMPLDANATTHKSHAVTSAGEKYTRTRFFLWRQHQNVRVGRDAFHGTFRGEDVVVVVVTLSSSIRCRDDDDGRGANSCRGGGCGD